MDIHPFATFGGSGPRCVSPPRGQSRGRERLKSSSSISSVRSGNRSSRSRGRSRSRGVRSSSRGRSSSAGMFTVYCFVLIPFVYVRIDDRLAL